MKGKKGIKSKNHLDTKILIPSSTASSDHKLGKHDKDRDKITGIERVD